VVLGIDCGDASEKKNVPIKSIGQFPSYRSETQNYAQCNINYFLLVVSAMVLQSACQPDLPKIVIVIVCSVPGITNKHKDGNRLIINRINH
jgi:hypothetical protein